MRNIFNLLIPASFPAAVGIGIHAVPTVRVALSTLLTLILLASLSGSAAAGICPNPDDQHCAGPPTNLLATVDSATQVVLTWEAPQHSGDNVSVLGYRIDFLTPELFFSSGRENGLVHQAYVIGDSTGNVPTTYTHDHVLVPETVLRYRVSAINRFGVGAHSNEYEITTPAAPDTAGNGPPDITGITVNGRRIVITFDEDLDFGSVPSTTNFLVRVHGRFRPEIENVRVIGSTVEIILTEASAVGASDIVKVRYYPPKIQISETILPITTGALKDSEGNLVIGFRGQLATNNTPLAVPNIPPSANAGSRWSVAAGASVTLDGSGSSDSDGTIVSYSWTQTGGDSVTLNNASSSSPSFTAPSTDTAQTLTFTLTVMDDDSASGTDTVDVLVSERSTSPERSTPLAVPNIPPSANAGSRWSVAAGASVTLDGSGSSDSDGTIVSYSWTQTGGDSVTLNNASSSSPSFTAPSTDTAQTLTFTLTVMDDDSASGTDTVDVLVSERSTPLAVPNIPPSANAGSRWSVAAGASVTLDGSGSSDSDGTIVSYSWTQTGGDSVTLNNASSSSPSFTAPSTDTAQTLTFTLTVMDDDSASGTDTVDVLVSERSTSPERSTPLAVPNIPPSANAGSRWSVAAGASVTLDGSGSSDSDGTIVSYSWTQTGGDSVTLNNASSSSPSFTAPSTDTAQTLTFTLTVMDDDSASGTDTVDVLVSERSTSPERSTPLAVPNIPPSANAGSRWSVAAGASVTLDGSGSSDSDGTIVSYSWTQTGGDSVTLNNASSSSPSFTAPSTDTAQTLTFTLTVMDDDSASGTDTVDVLVSETATSTNLESVPTDLTDDRAVLVALYNATDGDNWSDKTNWNSDEPLDVWYGVTTNPDGRITELKLSANQLKGSIPYILGRLTELIFLALDNNILSGKIPTELGNLANLRRLYLNDNQLTGMVPLVQLEALVAPEDPVLQELALWGNDQLTGMENISDELGKRVDRAALRALYESSGGSQWEENENWLHPTNPFSFLDWYGITTNSDDRVSELNLVSNGLKGEITNALEALADLETLDLFGNIGLHGVLPQGLTGLSMLRVFYMEETGVCASENAAFERWLDNIDFRGENCVTDGTQKDEVATSNGGGCALASRGWTISASGTAAFNLLLIVFVLIAIQTLRSIASEKNSVSCACKLKDSLLKYAHGETLSVPCGKRSSESSGAETELVLELPANRVFRAVETECGLDVALASLPDKVSFLRGQ